MRLCRTLVAVAFLVASGCLARDAPEDPPSCVSTKLDAMATMDAGGHDTGTRSAWDASADAGRDAGRDAARDATIDSTVDATHDAIVEGLADSSLNATSDTAADVVADSLQDAARDSGLDVVSSAAEEEASTEPDGSAVAELAERAVELVSQMTLEEKVSQMGHRSAEIPRLGIPAYNWWNEALHGVAFSGVATVFPQAISLAATFDPDLLHEVATAISTEARVKNNTENKGLTYWSPTINLARDPRWGRNEETYGEDPYLTSRMALSFLRGMQGDDPKYLRTIATVKHFAANNVEATRHSGSSNVDGRDLEEFYFPAFKAAAKEVGSVMCAYNRVNEVPACANGWMLKDMLRDAWGFQGYVVSDCGAVEDIYSGHGYAATGPEASRLALGAGTDLNCGSRYQADLVGLVSSGEVAESQLDAALERLFLARFRLGEFDPPESVPYRSIPSSALESQEHKDLALRAARESMVLLKNEGLLPLDADSATSIAVIGPNAATIVYGGYSGTATAPVTPLDGIVARAADDGIPVSFAEGTDVLAESQSSSIEEAAQIAAEVDVVVLVVGTDLSVMAEGLDRTDIALPLVQEDLIQTVAQSNPRMVVVLVSGAPLAINWADEHIPAILLAGYAGQAAGTAIAEVLFGDIGPAGRLPQTYYRSVADLPSIEDYDIIAGKRGYMFFEGNVLYPFGHGLSYTRFTYSNLKLSPTRVSHPGEVQISFDVKNTGSLAGDEVAQVYVHDVEAAVPMPKQQLKRFQRLSLEPGEKKTVLVTLPAQELASYDVDTEAWTVEPGQFEIMVGGSSADTRLTRTLTVEP